MPGPTPKRASDEKAVQWLAMRRSGLSLSHIGRATGCATSHIDLVTTAVRNADMLESQPSERVKDILKFYWTPRVPKCS